MSENPNKMTWDLESIFSGGSSSTEFVNFRKALHDDLKYAGEKSENLPKTLDEASREDWVDFMLLMQDIIKRIDHASGFASCLTAQDVKDEKALVILEEIANFEAIWQTIMTGIEDFSVRINDAAWDKLLAHHRLADVTFYWNEMRRNAKKKMEPKLEKLTAELAVNGYHGWNRLYTKIAGDLKADFVEAGETKTLSMGQLANRFNSPDRAIRRQAFDKLEETWQTVDSLAAIALNSQAGFRLSLYKNRYWESALIEPLLMGRLKQQTLDAMWTAVKRGGQEMGKFIDIKKKLLGIKNFRWYDQMAPVGEVNKTYSYDEACDFVLRHFESFSRDLAEFGRMAINKRWIEAEDRSGKMAGGFCTGLDVIKETRIFMTFSGNYDEMMTLAHELGHSYHNWVLKDREYFAGQYPMNLAETASTFNEHLVTDAALAEAVNDKDKLALLNNKIQEGFIMFCNLYCRYLFDCRFYEERKKGTVPKERLNELMVEAQKEAFGSILANDGYHPLFWASKLHFFETEIPFYNFPYTFGYLFAGGIYDLAKKEGPSFADKYRALLADTGSMTSEEVAHKHLGIDLTQITFWDNAVNRVLDDIKIFVRMAEK